MIYLRSKAFTFGFFGGLLLFVAANLYSYFRMAEYPSMDDGFVDCGVPFKLYAYGGFFGHSVILWQGLLADVLIAICMSIILGWVIERLLFNRSRLP